MVLSETTQLDTSTVSYYSYYCFYFFSLLL
jgi:hypothetical protein